MTFMMLMIPEATRGRAGHHARPEAVAAMIKYNEAMRKAGVLLALDGLHPPAEGVRVPSPAESRR